tara:strand:+ start:1494 stop:2555 length:1062 start_codon:yes stop_codon:yes gene_type:complete
MFDSLVTGIFNQNEEKKDHFGIIGESSIRNNSPTIFSTRLSSPPGLGGSSVQSGLDQWSVGSESIVSNNSVNFNNSQTDRMVSLDTELSKLRIHNYNLANENTKLDNFLKSINKTIVDSGFGNLGNLIEVAKKHKQFCEFFRITDIEKFKSYVSEQQENNMTLMSLIKEEKQSSEIKDRKVKELHEQINSLDEYYKQKIEVLINRNYESWSSKLKSTVIDNLEESEDEFSVSNFSKESTEIKKSNNLVKRKKWDEISENICIDCNGNGKTLSSVINRMTKIIKKSGISLDELKERRFVIPKCDNYDGKYKNMAYLRFDSNLEAKVAYNKLCEIKTGKDKVYFSRPNNLLKIKN